MDLLLLAFLSAWPLAGGIPAAGGRAVIDWDAEPDADPDTGDPVEGKKGGADDPSLVAVLEQGAILGKAERLTGGNMIKYVLRLDDGSREGLKVVFKPAQVGDWGDWRNEVAAWRLDQALGYGLVPGTARRELPFSLFDLSDPKVAAALRPDATEPPRPEDTVEGAVQVWVPSARVADEGEGRAWAELMLTALGKPGALIEEPAVAGFFVRLVILDFLLSNPDRYSGGNMLKDSTGRLWAIDNAGAFVGCVRPKLDLKKLRRFERVAVEALKKVDREGFRGQLVGLVSDRQFRQFWRRRREVLDRVRELVDQHGRKRVYF